MPSFEVPEKRPITNFVLENVVSYEELNAKDIQEGEQKFLAALTHVLERQSVEEKRIGIGSQSLVQKLEASEGVVLKRLMFGKQLRGQDNLTPDQYFTEKKKEYEVVKKYFGRKFVPDTEFAEVTTNFNSPHPGMIPGHEYVMIQDKLPGEDINFQAGTEPNISSENITPALKSNLADFITRYETMRRESETVIEDQLRIDFQSGEIHIADTDFLPSFRKFVEGNAFLEYVGTSTEKIIDTNSLIKLLGAEVPALAELSGISGEHLSESLPILETGEFADAASWLLKKLSTEGKTTEEKQRIVNDFGKLIAAIDYFPPEGDNIFIQRVKRAFHLEK